MINTGHTNYFCPSVLLCKNQGLSINVDFIPQPDYSGRMWFLSKQYLRMVVISLNNKGVLRSRVSLTSGRVGIISLGDQTNRLKARSILTKQGPWVQGLEEALLRCDVKSGFLSDDLKVRFSTGQIPETSVSDRQKILKSLLFVACCGGAHLRS